MSGIGKLLNNAATTFTSAHRNLILPIRIGAASILAGKEINSYSPSAKNLVHYLSFFSKIPLLGSLPYEKIATNTLSYTNFAVALSAIIGFKNRKVGIYLTPASMTLAAASSLSGIKNIFGERAFGVSLPEGLKDLSTFVWTVGSVLSLRETQASIDKLDSMGDKTKIAYLKTTQRDSGLFAIVGAISLLGRYIAAIRSPAVQLGLSVAPPAIALLSAWKGAYSPSSQLVNQVTTSKS